MEEELNKCQVERAEYLGLAQRFKADYLNLKKEEEARRQTMVEFVKVSLLADFLKLADSFELAKADATVWAELPANWRQGLEAIASELQAILRKHGVEAIVSDGPFDPEWHEAVESVPTANEAEDQKILAVLQTGYRLGQMVIRPAKVRLGVYQK